MKKTTAPVEMDDQTKQTICDSLEKVTEFLKEFPAERVDNQSWHVLMLALTSIDADDSTSIERNNMLNFHALIRNMAPALKVINEQLKPWFKAMVAGLA